MPASLTIDFRWEEHPDLLAAALGVYEGNFWSKLHNLLEMYRREIEEYAKRFHPWKNVTGDAEKELHATLDDIAEGFVIALMHGVPYGVYLEMGQYAIINPTMEAHYAAIMEDIRELVGDR
jgi:hypothetical protein